MKIQDNIIKPMIYLDPRMMEPILSHLYLPTPIIWKQNSHMLLFHL